MLPYMLNSYFILNGTWECHNEQVVILIRFPCGQRFSIYGNMFVVVRFLLHHGQSTY